jgi:hypothetical protein
MKYRGTVFFFAGFLATLGAGWYGFPKALYERAAQPFSFSHKTHTGEKVGMSCEDCHGFREDGRFAGVPGVESCAGCHAEPVTPSADEKVLVEQYVKPNREIPWLVYARQPENVFFNHASHVKLAKLACEECHADHGKSVTLRPFERNRISGYSRDIWGASMARVSSAKRPGMKMDDCARCHHENGRENACLDCHK